MAIPRHVKIGFNGFEEELVLTVFISIKIQEQHKKHKGAPKPKIQKIGLSYCRVGSRYAVQEIAHETDTDGQRRAAAFLDGQKTHFQTDKGSYGVKIHEREIKAKIS